MSLDKSLRTSSKLTRKRNVLSREERIGKLAEEERWEEGHSVFGLPKVKVLVKTGPKKPKKAKEAEEIEGVAPEEGEAPEADSKEKTAEGEA